MSQLNVELDVLTTADRRDLENALLRAARSATLEETRVLLLTPAFEPTERDGAIYGRGVTRRQGQHDRCAVLRRGRPAEPKIARESAAGPACLELPGAGIRGRLA